MQAKPIPQNLQELQQKVTFAENVKRITDQIHAANDLDHILLDLRKDILSIFDAEDLTIFAFDSEKKEIFSKIPHIDSVEEIRIPITEQSLAASSNSSIRRAAHDSPEKTKNPSRRLQRHSASPFSTSARPRRKTQPNSTAWSRTTVLPRTNWTRRLPSPGKACQTSRAS